MAVAPEGSTTTGVALEEPNELTEAMVMPEGFGPPAELGLRQMTQVVRERRTE
jgi:hypothetical protein